VLTVVPGHGVLLDDGRCPTRVRGTCRAPSAKVTWSQRLVSSSACFCLRAPHPLLLPTSWCFLRQKATLSALPRLALLPSWVRLVCVCVCVYIYFFFYCFGSIIFSLGTAFSTLLLCSFHVPYALNCSVYHQISSCHPFIAAAASLPKQAGGWITRRSRTAPPMIHGPCSKSCFPWTASDLFPLWAVG